MFILGKAKNPFASYYKRISLVESQPARGHRPLVTGLPLVCILQTHIPVREERKRDSQKYENELLGIFFLPKIFIVKLIMPRSLFTKLLSSSALTGKK